jgi:hypothetical protein
MESGQGGLAPNSKGSDTYSLCNINIGDFSGFRAILIPQSKDNRAIYYNILQTYN